MARNSAYFRATTLSEAMRVCGPPSARRGPKVFPSKPSLATLVGMEAALDYLARGWSVLPLEPRSKLPATSTSAGRAEHELVDVSRSPRDGRRGRRLGRASSRSTTSASSAARRATASSRSTSTPSSRPASRFRHRDSPHWPRAPVLRGRESADATTRSRGANSAAMAPTASPRRAFTRTAVVTSGRARPDEGIAALEEFELPLASRARTRKGSTPSPLIRATGFKGLLLATARTRMPTRPCSGFRSSGSARRSSACSIPRSIPSATLWRAPSRRASSLYHDFHARDREWLWLADALRLALGASAESLTPSAYVTWAKRLDIEAGVVAPATVPLGELPSDASQGSRLVYDGFRRLFEARWLHTPGEPAPFSHRFAAVWCGCAKSTVASALPRAPPSRPCGLRGPRCTRNGLWLPGEGVRPLRQTR